MENFIFCAVKVEKLRTILEGQKYTKTFFGKGIKKAFIIPKEQTRADA